jgi:hypothetical protein
MSHINLKLENLILSGMLERSILITKEGPHGATSFESPYILQFIRLYQLIRRYILGNFSIKKSESGHFSIKHLPSLNRV